MPKQSKITAEIYKRYCQYITNGSTKKAAAKSVGIPVSTMYDYVRRLNSNSTPLEYYLMNRRMNMSIIIKDQIHNVPFDSVFYKKNSEFFDGLSNRENFTITVNEYDKYIVGNFSDTVKNAIVATNKKASVKNNDCYYKGVKVPASLFKIIELASSKSDIKSKSIVKFADLLIKNPDQRVIDQLYDFLTHNDIQICPNGYILAYKSVRHNFRDHYSGLFDNSVGNTVKMDRSKVDSDPKKTCSHGLHVGSLSYIKSSYRNGRIVSCIINPADFVAIPVDYSGSKARVCKYKVSADATIKV